MMKSKNKLTGLVRMGLGLGLCIVLATSTVEANEAQRGRTDGAEGSELGKGGYSGDVGQWAVGAKLGATSCKGCDSLLFGAHVDYGIDDWAILEMGFSLYPDADLSIASLAGKFRTVWDPVAFYFLVGGEIGFGNSTSEFAVAIGAGADFLLNNKMEVGLGWKVNNFISDTAGDFSDITLNLTYKF